jgi:predicted nucleic acid-binding protein
MLAIDTNIIVRYLTGDDPKQAEQARALIDREDVFVCTTVLLEAAWVLQATYEYARRQVVTALRDFAGLPHVTVEDPGLAAQALAWAAAGMDFAYALHLAKTSGCDGFVTFDRRFARVSAKVAGIALRVP